MLFIIALPKVYPLDQENTWTIEKLSKVLKTPDEKKTIDNIHYFVMANIDHKPTLYPKTTSSILKTMTGDCTDKATLAIEVLRKLGYRTRKIHGFTEDGLHDWYEVKYNNTWYSPDEDYFEYHLKVGYGYW